jgi:Protein of unknown function (DUF2381)
MGLLFSLLFVAAAAQEETRYVINQTNRAKPINVRVAPGFVSVIRFDSPIETRDIACGESSVLTFKTSREDMQLNLSASASASTRAPKTNCQIPLANGLTVTLVVAVSSTPDYSLEIATDIPQADLPRQAIRRADSANDDQCDATLGMVRAAAESITTKRIDVRGVERDVVLVVREHVKLGSVAIVRFSVHNRSRNNWMPIDVRVEMELPGQKAQPLDSTFSFRAPTASPNEEIFGAVAFSAADVPAETNFSLQVMEKGGARHPRVTRFSL